MPDRYFDVGIAEQQAVLFAAGAALSGMRPVAAIYSTFLQRAFDQIVHDVCLQNLPVTFCMDRAGLVGDDGPTHHGVFDIAYLRALPHITLMAPRDEAMLVHMLHTALQIDGPAAVRYPRGAGVGVELPGVPEVLRVGTGEVLREGERVALVGYGTGVGKALGAADLLAERGLDVTVADARFAKPLDVPLLAVARRRSRPARHGRGGRPGRRLRQRGLGVAVRGGRARAADPARRPARPLRHARRSRAAARGSRLHRRAHRRARRGRRARPARRHRLDTSTRRSLNAARGLAAYFPPDNIFPEGDAWDSGRATCRGWRASR